MPRRQLRIKQRFAAFVMVVPCHNPPLLFNALGSIKLHKFREQDGQDGQAHIDHDAGDGAAMIVMMMMIKRGLYCCASNERLGYSE